MAFTMNVLRRLLIGLGVVVLAGGAVYALAPEAAPQPAKLALTAIPIPLNRNNPAQDRVGALRFMGALVLRSSDRDFGGVSALRAGPDGHMLAISDTGNWISFATIERDGWLIGVESGLIAPLLDVAGSRPPSKEDGDAESLEWDPQAGTATVSFEQDHRLQHYTLIDPERPASFAAPAHSVWRTPLTANWPANSGGEALADIGGGRLLLISEDAQAPGGVHDVLIRNGDQVDRLALTVPGAWHPTDAIRLDDGHLLVLLRRLGFPGGFAAALMLVPLPDTLAPGTMLHGSIIATLKSPLTIDNMEGLALRREAGRTFVYMVSDDNFFPFQRTLLMKFELMQTE